MPQRSFYTVLSTDLPRARVWYTDLLNYQVEFDSDWFVHLRDRANPALELGILSRDHDIVPPELRAEPNGGMLTVVVDDVDDVHQRAVAGGVSIIEPPRNLFYGQRRMLLRDAEGMVVDVSSECPPDPNWLASLGG